MCVCERWAVYVCVREVRYVHACVCVSGLCACVFVCVCERWALHVCLLELALCVHVCVYEGCMHACVCVCERWAV